MAKRHGSSYLGADGSTWAWRKIRSGVVRRDRRMCQLCGVVTLTGDVDHIQPRHLGGTDHPSNLRYLCKPCHAAQQSPETRAPGPTFDYRSRAPAQRPRYTAHLCYATGGLPFGGGDTDLGWWDGLPGTCPPDCPRAIAAASTKPRLKVSVPLPPAPSGDGDVH